MQNLGPYGRKAQCKKPVLWRFCALVAAKALPFSRHKSLLTSTDKWVLGDEGSTTSLAGPSLWRLKGAFPLVFSLESKGCIFFKLGSPVSKALPDR